MLKKIRVLFLGFVVLAGSACVTPTHASSASPVVLTYIQTTGPTGAREELIMIHNNSGVEVDITNWCLVNKTAIRFACFTPRNTEAGVLHHVLPAYSSATIASAEYMAARQLSATEASIVYSTATRTNGWLISGNDILSLIDDSEELIDSYEWFDTPPAGKAWVRKKLLSMPDIFATGNDTTDWASPLPFITLPVNIVELRISNELPSENNEEETGDPDDDGGQQDGGESPSNSHILTQSAPISITELLANPAGADAGKEYIELYNADDTVTYSLDGLRLRVGIESPKWYQFPIGMSIAPRQYLVITNQDINFTLSNTEGGVQLYYGDNALGSRIEYTSAKDDQAWVLIGDVWQYTKLLTPGKENPTVEASHEEALAAAESTAKTCAANQYRNPETGRCKLLATSTQPTACKAGQERNPETNRCRNIAVATAPTPCKEGQERNPETNRCRNVTKMSDAAYGVKGIQNKTDAQPSWYYWAGIAGVIVLILGYAVWEWREELLVMWRRMKAPFAKR